MATKQQREVVIEAVEKKQHDPLYIFSPEEIEAIKALLADQFADWVLPLPLPTIH